MKNDLHFEEPIHMDVGDVTLLVWTARTAKTGPEANIEVMRDKTIYQDWLKLDRAGDRRKFAAQVHRRVPEISVERLERRLLTFCQTLTNRIAAHSKPNEPEESNEYVEEDGNLFWMKPTKDGVKKTLLGNFTVRITVDTIRDNGVEENHLFDMTATCNGKDHAFTIPADDFHAMRWPPICIGGTAAIAPTSNAAQHIRYAIQQCSMDQKTERVYEHTGWRKEEGVWRYLHAAGGIGADGNDPTIRVNLAVEGLADYSLPDPPEGDELRKAIRASLAVLDASAKTITTPLLAAVYRAPLSEPIPTRLTVFLEGETGSFKTALTAIAQSHFGVSFDGENLPGGWTSTDNALEKKLFLAKDAVLVIDDFKPVGTQGDVQALHKAADRVIRAQGNLQGRARMTPEAQLKPTYDPRGLTISSGEETPGGHSLRARMLILEVEKAGTDLDRLSALQRDAKEGLLAQAMAGYLQWLAPQIDELKDSTRHEELREKARSQHAFPHDRTPDDIGSLALGLEMFLRFAEEAAAIDKEERSRLWEDGWKTLVELGLSQASEQSDEDDAVRFLELIAGGIAAGRAYIADAKTLSSPSEAAKWGWQGNVARCTCIGWLDGEDLFLASGPTYTLARRLAHEQGQSLGNPKTLWKRLRQRGLLVSSEGKRNTVKRSFGGSQQRCLHLRTDVLSV